MNRRISADRLAALLGPVADQSPAYQALATGLRLLISDGRVPAGTRLPSERELTLALGVSRTTVTRAYAVLKDAGFLTARQGSGSLTRLPGRREVGDSMLALGAEAGSRLLNLACAAPTAPPGVLAAYETAVAELPRHLTDIGYYPSGLPALRESLAAWYSGRGLPTTPDQVLVTSGSLTALAIAVRAFVGAGDRVLMESPTYANAISTIRGAGARITGADLDQTGWATASIVDTARQVRPRAAYLIPDWHNPTGLLMSDEERAQLAAALRGPRTLAIVDETMVELAIDEVRMPRPFAAHHPDTVTLGSASKSFWGGLRIGWIRAPQERVAALVAARLTVDLGAPVLEQLAALHLMADRDAMLTERRQRLTASRAALVAAVSAELPSWSFRVPAGGLSLWCALPRPVSSRLVAAAEQAGIQLAAGSAFAPEGGLDSFVRLPYTQPPEVLTDAVRRLAVAWESVARAPTRARVATSQAIVT